MDTSPGCHPFPLTKTNRLQLALAFQRVERVDLSIECILEGQMGRAYVDDELNPGAFMISIGPFIYLAGDTGTPGAEAILRQIPPTSIWMPSAPGWLEAGMEIYPDRLVGFKRFSYSTDRLSIDHLRRMLHASNFNQDVQSMDLDFIRHVWEQGHFIDLSEFDSPQDFIQRGIGFHLELDGETAGAAFSSLVCSKGIEVSIFVAPEFRREGIATALASALILWCLNNGADPHWDAANSASCVLAEKLGYIPTGEYSAHYLKEP